MQNFTKRRQLFILIVGTILVIFIAILGKNKIQIQNQDNLDSNLEENSQIETENETIGNAIFVHVCGSVNTPGMYELKSGDRIQDAIEAAGGFKYDANKEALNLSEKIKDEQKIEVPEKNLASENLAENKDETNTKININTAEQNILETLPGIGEKKAIAIIEYRKNKKFSKIEDLLEIDGIGKKTFEKIKELICI